MTSLFSRRNAGVTSPRDVLTFSLKNFTKSFPGFVVGVRVGKARLAKSTSAAVTARYRKSNELSFTGFPVVYFDGNAGIIDLPVTWVARSTGAESFDYEIRKRDGDGLLVSGRISYSPPRPGTESPSGNRGQYPTGAQAGMGNSGGAT